MHKSNKNNFKNYRVINIHLDNKLYHYILDLIRKKQHVKNMLIIIHDNTKNKWLKDNIINHMIVRNAFVQNKDYLKVDKGLKLRKLIIKEFGNEFFNNLEDIIKIFNNHIINGIVKELKANYDVCYKLYKKGLIKEFKIHTKKLNKIHNGSILIDSENVKLKDNILDLSIFSKLYEIKDKRHFIYKLNIDELSLLGLNENSIKNCILRIHNYELYLDITYNKKINSNLISSNRYASIDIGSNNHITLFIEDNKSLLIRSNPINRINNIINTIIPKIQSKIDKMFTNNKKNKKYNKNKYNRLIRRMSYLYEKRNTICNNEIHKMVNYIIKYLLANKIYNLIYGYNKDLKKNINIGKNNNKKFYLFPHSILLNILKYRCKEEGVNLILQEESYTSKVSCFSDKIWLYSINNKSNNPTETNGLRGLYGIRSLFKDKKLNIVFHSDINGAINILQKYLENKIIVYNFQIDNPLIIRNEFEFKQLLSNVA